jgi:hypothetical protein
VSPLSPLSPAANCHHLDAKPRGLTSLTTICRDGAQRRLRASVKQEESHPDDDKEQRKEETTERERRRNGRDVKGHRRGGTRRRRVSRTYVRACSHGNALIGLSDGFRVASYRCYPLSIRQDRISPPGCERTSVRRARAMFCCKYPRSSRYRVFSSRDVYVRSVIRACDRIVVTNFRIALR